MVTLLTIQIVSILATTLTNLLGILTFATDYWTIVIYDFDRLRFYAKSIVIEDSSTRQISIYNITENSTFIDEFPRKTTTKIVLMQMENDLLIYPSHKGIFRQCNSLSKSIRSRFHLNQCRVLKSIHNQYDDIIHGMNNPGRELIRLHNVAASCAILVVLLLCASTLIGVAVGILNSVVLATMTIGIIYLVMTMFSVFVVAILHTIYKSERKSSNCLALEILSEHLCSARSIEFSYSFILGCSLVCACFLTSIFWLSLQEKQRKFAKH